jgi:Rrf2 family nitric oxide-sensitive transcriptional repressor
MHAFLEVLGEYTLADAVRDPTRLCHLLGIEQDNILTMA